jgi:hypothetical protein
MNIINPNGWAPRNPVPDYWAAPIPITNPLIANRNNLYYNFRNYSAGGVNLSLFLCNLSLFP